MADHLSNLLEIEFQTGVSHVQRIYIMSKYWEEQLEDGKIQEDEM